MTGSLIQDCDLQDGRILEFVTFICGGNLKGKVNRHTPRTTESLQNEIRNMLRFRLTNFSVFRLDSFEDARRV
jgi:hypothetical protein